MLTARAITALDVRLSLSPPSLSSSTRDRVEGIWAAEKQRRGANLFNGRLFSVSAHDWAGRITGWLAEYKWFIAQRREPSLFDLLRVQPLAVTGLLHCKDGIVFGRRADHVEQDAGWWELVPSGGIDGSTANGDGSISLSDQVLAELEEEIGVSADMLSFEPRAFAMVHDEENHVLDVGILLRTDVTMETVISKFMSLPNREYVGLESVPSMFATDFVRQRGLQLAPVSQALLDMVGTQPSSPRL